ncbi:MAG TPA: LamG-like jellyroll fold domain-containing protein, partial [Polyangia bacterium]|nr:LamG-like jellyroll fold domain-containing protein [Polyangia bacterium]
MNGRRRLWPLAALLVASCGGSSLTMPDASTTDAASADVATALKVGLAGAWSFDGDGADHSGNKLDLGVTGLHFGAGKFGKGIQFAGERTPIAQRPVADASLDLTSGDFTVSFWIDFTMTASAQFVALKGYGSAGWFVGWAQTAWAYGLPKGGTFVPPGGSPTPGTFHHVVLQRAVDMIQIFVDGTSVGTATAVAGGPSTDPFQVGGYAPGGVTVATGQSVVDG